MYFLQKVLKKDSYAFGAFLAMILPVLFLLFIHGAFSLATQLLSLRAYEIEQFYLFSISINLLMMRYYLVNAKFVKTGKSILAVTFLLMLMFFITQ